MGSRWLRLGFGWVPGLIWGVAVLEVDGLVLVYGGAFWGWSRMGLKLV